MKSLLKRSHTNLGVGLEYYNLISPLSFPISLVPFEFIADSKEMCQIHGMLVSQLKESSLPN